MHMDNEGTLQEDALDDRFNQERVRIHRLLYSAISHDLKTPLASMIGALEIFQRMKDRLPVEKQDALIQTALGEAHRLDNFITNILEMGKLENGMVNVRSEQFDVGESIRNSVASLTNRLRETQVTIDTPSAKLMINSDPSLFPRALALVLDNAVKYGGRPSIIHISYGRNEENKCIIHITDNGTGIAPEQVETIFEKYTRFAKRDHQNAGTGLGLAICREIMRLLGGTVHVSETKDTGSTFTLILPL